MLENAERDGYAHVISWMPDGKSFKIHVDGSLVEEDEKAIVEILKRTFNQTRFKSFLRQLQLYGFERTYKGPRRGECKHELFVRGRQDLLHKKSIDDFQQRANDNSNRSPKSVRMSPTPTEVNLFMKKNDSRINACGLPSCPLPTPSITEGSRCRYLNTSVIPTKLINLVVSDSDCSIQQSNSCNGDYDDDELSMVISSPLLNKNLQVVDTVHDDDLISIYGGYNDFPDWTGMELEILQRALQISTAKMVMRSSLSPAMKKY